MKYKGNIMIIECPLCGGRNQSAQPPQPGKRYRCGKCGAAFSYQADNISNRVSDYPATGGTSTAAVSGRAMGYPPGGVKSTVPTKNNSFDTRVRYKTNPDWSFSDAFRPGGRFSRYQYVFFSIIVPLPFHILYALFIDNIPLIIALLAFPLVIVLAIMSIISAIRRLHDLGHRGWWYLLYLIPLVDIALLLYLIFMPGKAEENKWG